jgi:hypothetical protein
MWTYYTRNFLPSITSPCSRRSTSVFGLLLLFLVGWDCGHYWPIVPAPDDRWWWLWSNWWDEDWLGNRSTRRQPAPSATLSTTNPTWLYRGSKPGRRRGGKPATNRPSYGTHFYFWVNARRCQCQIVGWLMEKQLERTWKRSYSNRNTVPSICLEGQRKTTKASVMIGSVPAVVRTEHLPNTSPELNLYTSQLVQKLWGEVCIVRSAISSVAQAI